ncbi:hypothetical protein [[Limnothrix rosea] IAM M-220]|uniref:hypothetical protein n=1 Tax=[Limnothrix rosea] IAM M-220 TaxID=454133 RepID=UPI001C0C9C4E|nr:hypothetical protein [[Limnothrix rosea] IAM M-220]
MAQVLLDLPDDLAEKIQTLAQSDRLGEVLSMGLNQPMVPAHIYSYILGFLISNPTPEAIAEFRPTLEMQERLQTLLGRNQAGNLTPEEELELREYEKIEHLIVMWKQLSTQYPQMLELLKAEVQTTPNNNQSLQQPSFLGYMKDSVVVKGDIIEPIEEIWEVCQ